MPILINHTIYGKDKRCELISNSIFVSKNRKIRSYAIFGGICPYLTSNFARLKTLQYSNGGYICPARWIYIYTTVCIYTHQSFTLFAVSSKQSSRQYFSYCPICCNYRYLSGTFHQFPILRRNNMPTFRRVIAGGCKTLIIKKYIIDSPSRSNRMIT